jgi:hypothetical protein
MYRIVFFNTNTDVLSDGDGGNNPLRKKKNDFMVVHSVETVLNKSASYYRVVEASTDKVVFIPSNTVTLTDMFERLLIPLTPVSQTSQDADKLQNDCGVACVLMIKKWLDPTYDRTVNEEVDYLKIKYDRPIGLREMLAYIPTQNRNRIGRVTLSDIFTSLNEGVPFIALVDAEPLNGEKFPHYVVVYGYSFVSGRLFLDIADPYTQPIIYTTTIQSFCKAMEGGGYNMPWQGVLLQS